MQRYSALLCRTFRSSAGLQATTDSQGLAGDKPGAKAVLYEILRRSSEPLNSSQIWLQAEEAGMKSKRHVKQLLNAMRKASVLQTKPMGKGKNYTYDLRNTSPKVVANEIGKAPQ